MREVHSLGDHPEFFLARTNPDSREIASRRCSRNSVDAGKPLPFAFCHHARGSAFRSQVDPIPNDASSGASQAIRLENVSVNGGAIAAVGDVAVHKAAYLGDSDGSGIHSAADAFLVVQAALGLASGFSAHAWTDPRIVGDADGSGLLSAADAFLIVQEGLGLSEPFVPDNPHIALQHVGGGVDPQFRIGQNIPAEAGGVVSVPVNLAVEPAATNVGGFDFDLFFDASQLTIQVPDGVSAGSDTVGSWAVSSTLIAAGHLRVGMVNSRGQPLAPGVREIARLVFRVKASIGQDTTVGCPVSGKALAAGIGNRPEPVARAVPRTCTVDVAKWDGSETHPTLLDIEPVDPHSGGYVWTASDGSLLISQILKNSAPPPSTWTATAW